MKKEKVKEKDEDKKKDKPEKTPKPPHPVPNPPSPTPKPKPKAKVLFVIKKRSYFGYSYGLVNSCQFVANALKPYGVESKIVQVHDNNCINKEVHDFKPTDVIIEALWVVPSKFPILFQSQYPWNLNAKWTVRLHSEAPFLGYEGMAFEWIKAYDELSTHYPNFGISTNSLRLQKELAGALAIYADYTPNAYVRDEYPVKPTHKENYLDVSCWGAIRPLKNHLEQALGAMIFAESIKKKLRFHVNIQRVENLGAESIARNLRHLFLGTQHQLVEHGWYNHQEFIDQVRKTDIAMQVSMSETFNIVAADSVWENIPVVASEEIDFISSLYTAEPTRVEQIVDKLSFAWRYKSIGLHNINKLLLNGYNKRSIKAWLKYLKVD